MPLPDDAMLASIESDLRAPEEFVRRVFANMSGYQRGCQVRLACDAGPKAPDYLIELVFSDDDEIQPQSIAVFAGRTHKAQAAAGESFDRRWSRAAMNWEDMQALLGKLRGITPPPPKVGGVVGGLFLVALGAFLAIRAWTVRPTGQLTATMRGLPKRARSLSLLPKVAALKLAAITKCLDLQAFGSRDGQD